MPKLRPKLRVDVWSDIACPWCYVGKRRLEAAIARMPSPGDVEVVHRSYQLDEKAPRVPRRRPSYAERLARKYRSSVEQANAMIERMTRLGAAEGIEFRFDLVRRGNTLDAHRVLHLARERGVQQGVMERLMRAYFSEGAVMGDPETLARVAGEAGLEPEDVRRLLAGDRFADAVRADQEEARRHGVHAVPFFGIGEEYGVTGAQSIEILHDALIQAWTERAEREVPDGASGPSGRAERPVRAGRSRS